MIATTTFTSTADGEISTATDYCEVCSPGCHYLKEFRTVIGTSIYICERGASQNSTPTYEETYSENCCEDDYVIPDPIDRETRQLWRELDRRRPLHKTLFIRKPYVKRRMLNSMSGWIARTGRKRKKGK